MPSKISTGVIAEESTIINVATNVTFIQTLFNKLCNYLRPAWLTSGLSQLINMFHHNFIVLPVEADSGLGSL